jgi:hypothetical protein
MAYEDYIFFFFRETAVEYINCGKVREQMRKNILKSFEITEDVKILLITLN